MPVTSASYVAAVSAAGPEVVRDDVLAEPVELRGEHPAAVAARDRVDEPGEPGVVAQQEEVEGGPEPCQCVDLAHSRPQRLLTRLGGPRTGREQREPLVQAASDLDG